MSRRGWSPVRRAALAWLRATAVVLGQVTVLVLSLWLVATARTTAVPEFVAWLPLLAFTVGLLAAARNQYRRSSGGNPAWAGYLLVAAAPFTAFGGGCAVEATFPTGARLIRSGVLLGIELGGGCHTYLNGALLVLGYALLAVGLLAGEWNLSQVGRMLAD
jgi:hypothetical protein